MESAIRWSHAAENHQRFLVADIAGNRLQHCELNEACGQQVKHTVLFQREKLPNYTAFEWFRQNEALVAIGTSAGACRIVNIHNGSDVHDFPVKVQRKCNSVAFSANDLVAVGLDRTRGDSSLNIHDLGHQTISRASEPYRRLGGAEIITNVKFFADQPNTLLAGSAGIARGGQNLKLFDLRDHASAPTVITTRFVYLLSVDPLDENYFASAAAANENAINIWDKRWLKSQSASAMSQSTGLEASLEVGPVFDSATRSEIWSVRYSGYERGCFAAMSGTGELKVFQTTRLHEEKSTGERAYTRNTIDLSNLLTRNNLPVAFDFARLRSTQSPAGIITIRNDKALGFIKLPQEPPVIELSSRGDLLSCDGTKATVLRPCVSRNPVSEDIEALKSAYARTANPQSDSNWQSYFERHQNSHRNFESQSPFLDLALQNDVSRRRCKEGYLFDCDQNKSIVKDDPWLSSLWLLIKRLHRMATNSGMMHKGLDFSYFGVRDIWFSNFGRKADRLVHRDPPNRKEFSNVVSTLLGSQSYPSFEGVSTAYPGLRQLGLAICGHRFDTKRLREKCSEIISKKDYYKAIIVAVYHGHKDIAIELLKTLTRSKVMKDTGLAAVVVCKTITEEQKDLCQWMAEEAEDPYLRALLAYFVQGTWKAVADMSELPLIYRVAVALKYLSDEELDNFLENETRSAIQKGDTEGIVLTGLADDSMDLLQNYLTWSGDLQTAVLVASFTNTRYVKDARFETWVEAYFTQMQAWTAFIERVRFRKQYEHLNASGKVGQKDSANIVRSGSSVLLQCKTCQKTFSSDHNDHSKGTSTGHIGVLAGVKQDKRLAASGATCPHCGRPFSRCAICLLWQGAFKDAKPPLCQDQAEESTGSLIGYCMRCRHGWHPHHGREWFAKHRECPVAGCKCYCRLLDEPF